MQLPQEVFVTDGFPQLTYVPLSSGEKEQDLLDGLDQKNKIISISGPSKSGKTVLCERVIKTKTRYQYVYITGDSISRPEDIWYEAVGRVSESSGKSPYHMSHQERIRSLININAVLVIDDFHYIKSEIQPDVCRQIKNAAGAGLRIICLTVPHRNDDAVRGNPDLAGRFFSVDFEYWEAVDLLEIAEKGFPECGFSVPSSFKHRLASEALRSPQIMQTLCLETCRALPQDEGTTDANFSSNFLNAVKAKAIRSYDRRSDLQILRQGPSRRGTRRRRYKVKTGEELNIYEILAEVLRDDPPFPFLSLDDIRQRVSRFLEDRLPDNVRSALQKYDKIFPLKPLDWDDEKQRLTVNDPHFYFYLRNHNRIDPG